MVPIVPYMHSAYLVALLIPALHVRRPSMKLLALEAPAALVHLAIDIAVVTVKANGIK